jgi:hypothetical protein
VLEAALTPRRISACMITVPHLERKEDLQQITFLDTPNCRLGGATVNDGNSQPSKPLT